MAKMKDVLQLIKLKPTDIVREEYLRLIASEIAKFEEKHKNSITPISKEEMKEIEEMLNKLDKE